MDPIQIGIIGAGRIAYVHSRNIASAISFAEVKGIADPFLTDHARAWIKELNIPVVTENYQDLLNDQDIRAVVICSPTDTHARITREAVQAGKDVFCEKPVDLDPQEIRRTLEAVKKSGRKLQVGFNRRFDHNFAALRKAVETRQIGDLHMVRITSRDPSPPPIEYVKSSGGLFMDMTIHDFDMVRFLSGSEIAEVSAYGAVRVDPAIGEAGDIDTAVVSMKLSDGSLAYIENSRKAVYGYDQRAEVFGSLGAMETANDVPHTAVFSGETGIIQEKPLYFFLERYEQAFVAEMKAFLECLRSNTEVPVGGIDGLNSVLAAKAALESLKTGKSVQVSYGHEE